MAVDETRTHFLRLTRQAARQAAQHQYDAAIATYREALGFDPEYTNTYLAISSCLAHQYDMTHKRALLREAIDHAQRAVALDPENSEAHRMLGNYLLASRRYFERKIALKHLHEALRLSPAMPINYAILAKYYQWKGASKKAQLYFNKALELDPENIDVLTICTRNYLARGDLSRTEQYARELLRLSPGHPAGLVVMGMILLKKRNVAEAMEHARIVIAQNPNDYQALLLIALIETRKNPLRGGSFRVALWMRRWRNRVATITGMAAVTLPVSLMANVQIPILLPYLLLIVYLQLSSKAFRRYVRKNYLSALSLRGDF